jgi:hypothetical protein
MDDQRSIGAAVPANWGRFSPLSLRSKNLRVPASDDYETWAKRWQVTGPGERRPEFIGLTLPAAEETAAQDGMTVRVFGPPTDMRVAFTANFKPSRLNLLVRDGFVVDAVAG